MNADSLDSLTERVLGAIFEVSNTLGVGLQHLGCRLPREGLPTCSPQRTRPSRHSGDRRSFLSSSLPGPLCGGVLCRHPRGRCAGAGTEMCGAPRQRAHCPMPQLSAGLRPYRLSSGEFPEAQSRVEAGCERISDSRATRDVVPVNRADTLWRAHLFLLDTTLEIASESCK